MRSGAFAARCNQVRNAPINVQGVVTYNSVVRINNKELLLKPGMTANVQFLVSAKRRRADDSQHRAAVPPAGGKKRSARVAAPGAGTNGAAQSANGERAVAAAAASAAARAGECAK